jgi:hypothetical protein
MTGWWSTVRRGFGMSPQLREGDTMSFLGFFKRLGQWLKAALRIVEQVVPDEYIKMALDWVRIAAERELSNDERREFVVKMLTSRGIPESIARLATELAVQLFKKSVREGVDRLEDELTDGV